MTSRLTKFNPAAGSFDNRDQCGFRVRAERKFQFELFEQNANPFGVGMFSAQRNQRRTLRCCTGWMGRITPIDKECRRFRP